ncbi:hypothetical protein [Ruegeria sp. SCP11]|uniref:hypothetical protein n=1 Tax=Ruegeria sp. SCP11 TaxID=3141378 RepID=UPI00333914E5
MTDLIDRVKDLVRSFNFAQGYDQADFDELVMLTKASEAQLPARFVDLVKNSDQDFPGGDTPLAYEKRVILAKRLSKILTVSDNFGLTEAKNLEDFSDELVPTFSLGAEDKARVLDLCSQMRKIVLATTDFDQPHKRRLLNRIAGIEAQVEQPKGMLDVVRAGVSDVGETLGKFGKDIKPLTDRMKEVAQIARSNSKEYDQIPAPEEVKQLPAPEENSEG